MGPISRVNNSQSDPYLQWRERLEERRAEKEGDSSAKEVKSGPVRRTRDEYVPGTDGDSEPGKIPEKGREPDRVSKKQEGKKTEKYLGSTDKVDREIEKLKKRKEELEGQIRTEKDERRIRSLEQELAQVERELSQKDNDGYRQRNMVVTKM